MNEADGSKRDGKGNVAGRGGGGFSGKGGRRDGDVGLGEIVLLVYMPIVNGDIIYQSQLKADDCKNPRNTPSSFSQRNL